MKTPPSPHRLRFGGVLLLLHYWLPLALGWSLAVVMKRSTGAAFSPSGMALLLTGIGAAYSFDRLIDPPAAGSRPRWVQWSLYAAAAGFSGAMLLAACNMPPRVIGVAALLSATSLLYPRLKHFPLVKTIAVAFAWIWASAALPFSGEEQLAWKWWALDVSLPLLLLISAGCILCDLKDARQDKAEHVPSLPVLLGSRAACLVAAGLAILATGLAFLHGYNGVAICGLVLAFAAQFPALLAREALGPIVIDAILVIPGLLIAAGAV